MRCFHSIGSASLLAVLLALTAASDVIHKEPVRLDVQAALDRLPLYFIENRGQIDRRVAYYVQGRTSTVYFTSDGLTLALGSNAAATLTDRRVEPSPVSFASGRSTPVQSSRRWVVKLDFVGANPNVRPVGLERGSAVISYFKGPKEQWKTGLPAYTSVVYPDLWPGIDLIYSGTVNRLKSTFIVKPGADPKKIRLAYRGVTGLALTQKGQLEITTPNGSFAESAPYAYQESAGVRVEVPTAYVIATETGEGQAEYGFGAPRRR